MRYVDRDNNEISFAEWTNEQVNRRVANTKINDRCRVSTIWLGVDSGDGLIFETMIEANNQIAKSRRYETEFNALYGHYECVREASWHMLINSNCQRCQAAGSREFYMDGANPRVLCRDCLQWVKKHPEHQVNKWIPRYDLAFIKVCAQLNFWFHKFLATGRDMLTRNYSKDLT